MPKAKKSAPKSAVPKYFLYRCANCNSEDVISSKDTSGDPTERTIACDHCGGPEVLEYVGEVGATYEPVTPTESVESPPDLEVVYAEFKIMERSTTSELGPITPDDWSAILGWETEKQYQERWVRQFTTCKEHLAQYETTESTESEIADLCECSLGDAKDMIKQLTTNPDYEAKAEHFLFGDDYHCCYTIDGAKVTFGTSCKTKVRCWNNTGNRPFDEDWCEDLIHTHLQGHWAGPYTLPGETVNGETVRVSRYGRTISGQHTGTACIIADEILQASRTEEGNAASPRYPAWNGQECVFTEAILITGVSEDERVLRTIDYVKPRTVADMLYTTKLFRDRTPTERKEMTRMLALAIDTLWDRTATKGYKTHPEVTTFLERHRRLLKCVEHIFMQNVVRPDGGRRISKLRVQPGVAAAVCYLMACGTEKTTDYSDEYRNQSPPSERGLDWGYWNRAYEFWVALASDRSFIPVRTALTDKLAKSSPLDEENIGLGGRVDERLALLSKAWEVFKDHPNAAGPPFTNEDLLEGGALFLSYNDLDDKGNKLPEGKIRLLDDADFQGIDCPDSLSKSKKSKVATRNAPDPPAPSESEIARLAEEARARRETSRR